MGKRVGATERNKIGFIINHSEADLLFEHRRLVHYRRFRMFSDHQSENVVTAGTRTVVEPLSAYLCDGDAVSSLGLVFVKETGTPTEADVKTEEQCSSGKYRDEFFPPREQYGS